MVKSSIVIHLYPPKPPPVVKIQPQVATIQLTVAENFWPKALEAGNFVSTKNKNDVTGKIYWQ